MTPRKPRDARRAGNSSQSIPNYNTNTFQPSQFYYQQQLEQQQQQQPQYQQYIQPSDYESDTAYYSEAPPPTQDQPPLPPPQRTNSQLNLSVLTRHNPSISSILSIAPYAVLYTFSAQSSAWEKAGVEGTLFVCHLHPGHPLHEERYAAIILNRRGLENFEIPLLSGRDVEITDSYVILTTTTTTPDIDGAGEGNQKIYGLWIFSEQNSSTEDTRTLNAKLIQDCATAAEASRHLAETNAARATNGHTRNLTGDSAENEGALPMGREVSLSQLFGQQRKMDDAWSVKVHSPPPMRHVEMSQSQPRQQLQQNQGHGNDVLGTLFRNAGLGYPSR